MRNVKIALTGLAIAGVAAGSFLRWTTSSSRVESKALGLYLQGESRQAYEQLVTLENRVPLAQLLLYQGYTLRDNNLLNRSTQRFLQAIRSFEKEGATLSRSEKALLLENGLNLTLNGFLANESDNFEEGLKAARKADPQHPWVIAFEALSAEQKGDYAKASALAKKSTKRSPLSKWMAKPFSKVFTPYWEQLVIARGLIEEGKITTARENLSQIVTGSNPHLEEQVKLLMGMSYLQEAQKKPLDVSLAFIQRGYKYLKDLPLKEPSAASDYAKIINYLQKSALNSLQAGFIEDLNFYVEAFTHWKDSGGLRPIAEGFIDWLVSKEFSNNVLPNMTAGVAKLSTYIHSSEWQDELHEAISKKLKQAIAQQRWDAIQQFWTITASSPDTNPLLISKVADTVEGQIEQMFQKLLKDVASTDSPQVLEPAFRELKQILPILAQIESDPLRYQNFLQKLVDHAVTLIQAPEISPASDEVFSMLMEATSPPQPDRLRAVVKDRLSKRFGNARNVHDTKAMAKLYDIAQQIGLDAIPTYTLETISNMVADARYLLESDQIQQAQDQLRWILKLAPQNEQARFLLGSSLFAGGEYDQAANLLKDVPNPSHDMAQVLAICYLRSGQGEKALIQATQIREKGKVLSDRLLLEIGVYQAAQKQWRSAADSLDAIRHKTPDVWIYILACGYRLEEPTTVWRAYNQLPSVVRANRQITALALRGAQSIGLNAMADSILERSLQVDPSQTVITKNAQAFLEGEFAPFELDLSIAAASYFQTAKADAQRALSILERSQSNDWHVFTERAKAFIQLGLTNDALEELGHVQLTDISSDTLDYWLTLSHVYRLSAEFGQCQQLLDRIEAKLGTSKVLKIERANFFAQSRRYDRALECLEGVISSEDEVEHIILYTNILVRSGKFEEALKAADSALRKDHSAATTWKIASIVWPAQENLKAPSQIPSKNLFELLNAEQKGVAIQHLIRTQTFAHAHAWAAQFTQELKSSFEGKFALMQLALLQRQLEQAQDLFAQLLEQPYITLEQYSRLIHWLPMVANPALISNSISKVADPLQDDSSVGMSARIKSYMTHLQVARIMLDKTSKLDEITTKRVHAIRERTFKLRDDAGPLYAFWLYASSCNVLAEPLHAEPELEACTRADPSYADAFLQMSAILLDAKQWNLASSWAQKALVQNPRDPLALLQIAKCRFEQFLVQPTQIQTLELSKQSLKECLESAPYLADAYVLTARINMFAKSWADAYNQLMLADSMKKDDRDILSLLSATLQKRIETEGSRIEWIQQLRALEAKLVISNS